MDEHAHRLIERTYAAVLEPDAWKDEQTEVYLFDAEIFGSEFNDIG